MRGALVWLINAVCRPVDWAITRYGNRLNGDDDATQ